MALTEHEIPGHGAAVKNRQAAADMHRPPEVATRSAFQMYVECNWCNTPSELFMA
jgi:hypothetical protein